MRRTIVVTGTDTDVGKTVFCAGLAQLRAFERYR
jgi:dethiobiotin synthetase